MKILRLLHPDHGICAQEVIRGSLNEAKIKRIWAAKYGQMIKKCTYECYNDAPKAEEIINLRTGYIYKNKYEAKKDTGLTINYINKLLGKRSERNTDYFLVWNKNKAI